MKSLVTGGAGFIGSHLVERLLAEGHEVVVIDNFSSGHPRNLASVRNDHRLHVVEADITHEERIRPHFKGVDWVFHYAARGEIVPSIEKPVDYHTANVTGTVSVLEGARAAGVKRLVYAASSSCYGIPDVYPTPESSPLRPQYPYALTKLLAEQCVLHWCQVYRLPAVSIRIFNAYGTRSRTSGSYGAVFGVFLAQKIHGKPFTVVGDGTQTRDFVYVTDVADAFYLAAASEFQGEIYNLGAGNPISVNRLVELLGPGEVVHLPKRPREPDITHADIRKIRQGLGWTPRVSIEEGVGRMLKNLDYWREAPLWTPDSIREATRTWFQYLSS